MRARNLFKHIRQRKPNLSSPVALGLMCGAGFFMLMQNPPAAQAATETGAVEFKVLEATVGSGSRSKEAPKPKMQFEVIDASTGSGMGLKGQEELVPAVSLPAPAAEPNEAASVLTAQKASNSKTKADDSASNQGTEPEAERAALFAALERWHQQTLANYSFNIASLQDPFLPIQEVRGTVQDDEMDAPDDPRKPMILRLSLNQLKLVAITTLSDRPGGALASFEDGAGASYILRQGDLIGRNGGRIISIEPTQVTVEEPPRGSRKEPEITVMKLDVLSSVGLTREENDRNTPPVPAQSE